MVAFGTHPLLTESSSTSVVLPLSLEWLKSPHLEVISPACL